MLPATMSPVWATKCEPRSARQPLGSGVRDPPGSLPPHPSQRYATASSTLVGEAHAPIQILVLPPPRNGAFSRTSTLAPASWAVMAVTTPAPPYPTTTTSASLYHFSGIPADSAFVSLRPARAVAPTPTAVALIKSLLERTFLVSLLRYMIFTSFSGCSHDWVV